MKKFILYIPVIQFYDVCNVFEKYSFETSMRLVVSTYTNSLTLFKSLNFTCTNNQKRYKHLKISPGFKNGIMFRVLVNVLHIVFRIAYRLPSDDLHAAWMSVDHLQSRNSIDRVRAIVNIYIYTQ